MAYLKINFAGVQAANAKLARANSAASRLCDDVERLGRTMEPELKSRYDIERTLERLHRDLAAAAEDGGRLYRTVESAAGRYRTLEVGLCAEADKNLRE